MKIKASILPIALVLALGADARAEFSPAEKAQIAALGNARAEAIDVISDFGFIMNRNPGLDREAVYQVLRKSREAFVYCTHSLQYFSNQVRTVGQPPPLPTRQDYIDTAFSRLDACIKAAEQVEKNVEVVRAMAPDAGWQPLTASLNQVLAMRQFDRTLSYHDYAPPGFPSIVTPHGDFKTAIYFLQRSHIYMMEQPLDDYFAAYRAAEFMSPDSVKAFTASFGNFRKAVDLHTRVWLMDLAITLPDDAAIVEADMAAGSGIRPFEFWRLLLQIEYLFAKVGGDSKFPQHVSGREVISGATSAFAGLGRDASAWFLLAATENAASASLPEILTQQMKFWGDLMDGWGDLDAIAQAYMGFFHGFTTPPGGGGGGSCPQFRAEAEVIDLGDAATVQCFVVEVP